MNEIIWEGTVDGGQFICKVLRTDERTGVLTVTEVSSNKELLHELVGLSYGAAFGPDVDARDHGANRPSRPARARCHITRHRAACSAIRCPSRSQCLPSALR